MRYYIIIDEHALKIIVAAREFRRRVIYIIYIIIFSYTPPRYKMLIYDHVDDDYYDNIIYV